MYKLKQVISNIGKDRKITDQLKVKNGIILLESCGIKFKYEQGNWYQLCGDKWVNLQGGVPDYAVIETDELEIFEDATEKVEEGE